MPGNVFLWTPVIYALIGSVVVLMSGDRFQVTTYTFTIGPGGFVAIWVAGLAVLFFLYKWLLRDTGPRPLFWLHFMTTFLGLGGLLYLLLPTGDNGQSLLAMVRYLGGAFTAAFLILVGTMSMLVLILREILRKKQEEPE